MADLTREQQREQLHRTIWGIANEVRGSIDAWDFKQYVLGMQRLRRARGFRKGRMVEGS